LDDDPHWSLLDLPDLLQAGCVMDERYPLPTGPIAPRIHGARSTLLDWARMAHAASLIAESPEAAAALRGKRMAYREAADLIAAIEQRRRLPQRWIKRAKRARTKSPAVRTAGSEIAPDEAQGERIPADDSTAIKRLRPGADRMGAAGGNGGHADPDATSRAAVVT
jgi:hypothetical protein